LEKIFVSACQNIIENVRTSQQYSKKFLNSSLCLSCEIGYIQAAKILIKKVDIHIWNDEPGDMLVLMVDWMLLNFWWKKKLIYIPIMMKHCD